MGKFNRSQVYQVMEETKILPLFYHANVETVKEVIEACYNQGITIFEFTHRGPDALNIFKELISWSTNYPNLILGIGSIIEENLASLYINEGANFIISPVLNKRVATVCNRRKVAWIPGCASPTEMSQAEEWGAEVVKIFPASLLGGAKFVTAVKGPMPWLKIMASGGITINEKDLLEWKDSGVTCLGFGSSLINTLPNGKFDIEGIQKNLAKIRSILGNG